MATPTYTPIASITLGSSASSVTFSNIPQNYRDLVLVQNVSFASDSETYIRFNSDSSNNYFNVFSYGGTNGVADSGTSQRTEIKATLSAFTSFWNTLNIMDYSVTNNTKLVLLRLNNVGEFVGAQMSRWANNSAITTIEFSTSNSVQYLAGSTFALYGIEA